ncbi:hypothetical protein JCM5350_006769 [Sporobolomyces pararoseus]
MSASTAEASPSPREDGQSSKVVTSAEPSTAGNLSSSAGSPPVRPPKAAKRPSTASLSNQPPIEADAAQGLPVALGAPAAGQAGSEGGGGETVDPSTNDTTNTNSEEVTKELNTGTTASTTVESSETASSSKPVQPAASFTREQTNQKPSTSTPSASASSAPNTTSRAVPSSSSTSKPATSTPKKKRKGGPFSFLFACVPCISDPGHDDDYSKPQTQKKPVTPPSTTSPTATKENEKVAQPEPQTSKTSTIDEKSPIVPSTTTAPTAPVETETAITPTSPEPVVASTLTPPPPPSTSPTPQGVTLPREETEGVTSGAVVPPGQATLLASPPTTPAVAPKSRRRKSGKHPQSSGTEGIITSVPEPGARQGGIILAGGGDGTETSEDGSEVDDEDEDEYPEEEEEEEDEEQSLIARGGVGIPIGEDGLPHPLLDELSPELKGRKCLVLDLDETLVHSSFKMVHQADYVVPVEIENQFHNVYVIKRPGVDGFLKAMGEIYEVVVFTASLSKYADPVLDQLDIHRVVKHRLFRESCYNNKGNYVKDLSQLGRPIDECIIIDNSPASYVFHVNNAVPISSWFNDPHDTELTDLVPFLTDLSTVDDVRSVLDAGLYQHLAQTQDNVFNQI